MENNVTIKIDREPKKYRVFELDFDKINSIDDCKKILNVLCKRIFPPLEERFIYNDIEEIEEYFK